PPHASPDRAARAAEADRARSGRGGPAAPRPPRRPAPSREGPPPARRSAAATARGEWRSAAPRRRSGARPRGRGPTGVAPPRPGRRSPGALARAREIELALDREGGLLAGVPVVERLLLERPLLVATRRPCR